MQICQKQLGLTTSLRIRVSGHCSTSAEVNRDGEHLLRAVKSVCRLTLAQQKRKWPETLFKSSIHHSSLLHQQHEQWPHHLQEQTRKHPCEFGRLLSSHSCTSRKHACLARCPTDSAVTTSGESDRSDLGFGAAQWTVSQQTVSPVQDTVELPIVRDIRPGILVCPCNGLAVGTGGQHSTGGQPSEARAVHI